MNTKLRKFTALSARSLDIIQNTATQKKFIRKTKRDQRNLAAEKEAHFGFRSGMSSDDDLVVYSGATIYMIKDRTMFASLGENFKRAVSNAKFSESKFLGKGQVRFRVKDEKGKLNMIELKNTLYVPENSRILLSVSKMKEAGAACLFVREMIQLTH